MRQLAFAFLIFTLTAAPAFGQTVPSEKDSVTVSVEALRNLKEHVQEQERKIALQDSLIEEQAHQIDLWQEKARQDSLILNLTEQRIDVKNERIEIRDERINRLEEQKTWETIKRYIWTGGSLVIGFLIGSAS